MHELSIAEDLFRVVEDKAKENNLKEVTRIVVIVGEASGIEEDFLRHSLMDHVMPGTIAEKAELEITKEPLQARCQACGKEIDVEQSPSLECPDCGDSNLEITQGKNVYLQSIEGE
ncbi:MAG: hydrogenase maturation nickel metallochaperone HypA [Elusimicrobiota bacterium]|nr:hydrogenase maturation nickel metallochaperone HypA [Elusimicrobiota bacterium]MDH5662272.1 hydrogenase maturation nickel metallochaperone HypA [Elusimicrobiota bacterium]